MNVLEIKMLKFRSFRVLEFVCGRITYVIINAKFDVRLQYDFKVQYHGIEV